jgi:hypothetical protein
MNPKPSKVRAQDVAHASCNILIETPTWLKNFTKTFNMLSNQIMQMLGHHQAVNPLFNGLM